MSEEIKPVAVPETQPTDVEIVNYADKSLAELSELMQSLVESEDRMKRSKEAEAIKSAFYKRLSKEKQEAGEEAPVEEPDETSIDEGSTVPMQSGPVSPFAAIEAGFKSLYVKYKKERAEYNREQDAAREENLKIKQAIIEELKALVENPGDIGGAFPKFRDIQNRWRETGPVPQQNFRDVNDTYQLFVTKFYDLVDINRELRDLDFKKNLEAKTELCERAEALSQDNDVVEAFKELQKLHEQWKDLGPVAKEFRDEIWERFRAATTVINKNYQAHFEEIKGRQEENLKAKIALCEKVEEIAAREITTSTQWNNLSKEIEAIQAEWRKIGYATRKENQKIYDRFRAACDKFFERKRASFSEFKDSMNANLEKKMAIIEEAEALAASTDWKATADRLVELQKQWKEIGAVPRKKSEQLWKRFRTACDTFFQAREAARKEAHARRESARERRPQASPKDRLREQYAQLQQEIQTYENNIGFFGLSKGAEKLKAQMQERIDAAKAKLEDLKKQIRAKEQEEAGEE
ncbi:MAG: DUF349 domain-containing protein [Bacteroidales bacterium]|nr:DUF349 domain-containing protein [Bacteroidales bacterium]